MPSRWKDFAFAVQLCHLWVEIDVIGFCYRKLTHSINRRELFAPVHDFPRIFGSCPLSFNSHIICANLILFHLIYFILFYFIFFYFFLLPSSGQAPAPAGLSLALIPIPPPHPATHPATHPAGKVYFWASSQLDSWW